MKLKYFFILSGFIMYALSGFSQAAITDIQARLFYNQANSFADDNDPAPGSFSENIVDNNEFILYNTIIGEGSAAANSDQTIFRVEISSNKGVNFYGKIKFTIQDENRKTILLKENEVYQSKAGSKYYFIHVLDNPGCGILYINATLYDQDQVISKMEKSLDFGCGE